MRACWLQRDKRYFGATRQKLKRRFHSILVIYAIPLLHTDARELSALTRWQQVREALPVLEINSWKGKRSKSNLQRDDT
jgi:hypothetical protein